MKIYFDSCAVQRPLYTINHLRLALEIEALLGVFEQIESGAIDLVSSEVLEFELDRIPTSIRKYHALNILSQAREFITITEEVERRARYFTSLSVNTFDALHLASAEASGADYFCTCDDRLLRRARMIPDLAIIVVSPLELIEELDL